MGEGGANRYTEKPNRYAEEPDCYAEEPNRYAVILGRRDFQPGNV